MDTDKKKIIAGVGLLGTAAIAYALSRKTQTPLPPPPPPTYTCHYCGETFASLEDLLAHLVLEDSAGTYYSPYGGTRMPLCTDILIPNVPAFDHSGEGWPAWAGGDMVWSEYFGPDFYYIAPISEFRPAQCLIEIAEQLPQGQPIAWTPSDAVVANWVTNYSTGRGIPIPRLLVAATEYTCPEYWHTKHELAAMIAGRERIVYVASEWTYIYGKTCPTCGGTGQVVCTPGMHGCRPGQMTTCLTCGGGGIIVIVDLTRGIRDWIKPFDYYVWYYDYTYTTRIRCPVCDTVFQAGLYDSDPGQAGREDAARFLLNHIETNHPNHPLTSPAWF
jgi:hypothetical protein